MQKQVLEAGMGAIQSPTGVTWLDNDGILIAVANKHAVHTLADAVENHEINIKLAEGVRRPFLIDISEVKSMSRDARNFYSGPEPEKTLTAVAIVTKSNIGRVVANFFFGMTTRQLPTKLFNDHEAAKNWLMQFKNNPDSQ
jgi:hypothetical protein